MLSSGGTVPATFLRQASLELGELLPLNRETYRVLSQLYQMTVTDISHTPAPSITIAK